MPHVQRYGVGWADAARADPPGDPSKATAPYSALPMPLWRESLIDEFIRPHVGSGITALEVGPGTGEWTEHVVDSVQTLIVADRRVETIDVIRDRFGPRTDLRDVRIVDDRLGDLPDDSVDLAYSLDFFPFIDWSVLDQWLGELNRVLRPGGHLVVHHAATPRRLRTVAPRPGKLRPRRASTSARVGRAGTNRSALSGTAASFTAHGLVTTRQTSAWGPSGEFTVDEYRDVITVARKPAPRSG